MANPFVHVELHTNDPAKAKDAPTVPPIASINERKAEVSAGAIAPPIELATNREAVKVALRESILRAESKRQSAIAFLGATAIIGGIAVLLWLGLLAVLRLSITTATD